MFNPADFYPNPGSYDEILKRMTRRMRDNGIDQQIVDLLQQSFEKELGQGIVLSRPERDRLFQQVSMAILSNVLESFGSGK